MPVLSRSQLATFSLAAISAASALVSAANATVVYSNGFESATTGASLTAAGSGGFTLAGTGTSAISTAVAATGTKSAQITPAASTAGSWWYKNGIALPGVAATSEPVVTSSASIGIFNPTAGTANRGIMQQQQIYDANFEYIADAIIVWDAQNTLVGGGANHYYIFFDWYANPADLTGDGFGYDLGVVAATDLSSIGFWNFSIAIDFSIGDITFAVDGVEESTHGTFDVGAYAGFGSQLIYQRRSATAGTLPRLFMDDYTITTSASLVPEPTSLGLLSLGAMALTSRRRKN